MLAKAVERFVSNPLERYSQDDETDIAIFGLRAGVRDQRSGEGGGKKSISRLSAQKELLYAGNPEECASNMRTVTASRRGSSPANSPTAATTGKSRSSKPRSYKIMAMLVVAMTFVREARSNTVSAVASESLLRR